MGVVGWVLVGVGAVTHTHLPTIHTHIHTHTNRYNTHKTIHTCATPANILARCWQTRRGSEPFPITSSRSSSPTKWKRGKAARCRFR